jgi:hypothetical protein
VTETNWPLDDDRLRFYLRNRTRIEEWAAIAIEVRQATIDAFLELRAPVEQLRAELGVDLRLDDANGDFPRWVLRRPSWPLVGTDTLVAVVLEAERRSIVADADANAPYVGIRVGDPQGVGAQLRAGLLSLGKEPDFVANGYRTGRGPYWPVFRRIVAAPGWWEAPETWTLRLMTALAEGWSAFAGRIDEALVQQGPPDLASIP